MSLSLSWCLPFQVHNYIFCSLAEKQRWRWMFELYMLMQHTRTMHSIHQLTLKAYQLSSKLSYPILNTYCKPSKIQWWHECCHQSPNWRPFLQVVFSYNEKLLKCLFLPLIFTGSLNGYYITWITFWEYLINMGNIIQARIWINCCTSLQLDLLLVWNTFCEASLWRKHKIHSGNL